jgi:hypothetical protein
MLYIAKVSFSIKLAAFPASGWADPPPAEHLNTGTIHLKLNKGD